MNHPLRYLALVSQAVITVICACNTSQSVPEIGAEGMVLVVTTDHQTGSYAVVDPRTRTAVSNVEVIHPDSVCRVDPLRGTPYIVGRLGADLIDVLDPEDNWRIQREYSVGAGTNPQDIAVLHAGKAYVPLYETAYLRMVNPFTGEHIGDVDLSDYADADGIPELSWAYALNGRVYVLVQRLSRPDGFLPTDYSQILVIDGSTDQVLEAVILSHPNPFGKLRYNEELARFVILESGMFTTLVDAETIDGAIEYFNPLDNTLSGPVITAEELGGNIVDAVVANPNRGYAIVSVRQGVSASTHLVSFDPNEGKKLDTLVVGDSWDFSFIELSPDHRELWLAQQTLSDPGIRIFDAETGDEQTSVPIDVGLPPVMICFMPQQGAE